MIRIFNGEYSTGELTKIMKGLERSMVNVEAIKTTDSWYLVKYSKKVLVFSKVSKQKWVCLVNRLEII